MKKNVSRRSFIKGAGVALALPYLESLLPLSSKAYAQALNTPLRLIVLYKPNGEYPGSWDLSSSTLPYVLSPLQSLKSDVTFVTGLRNRASEPYADGHAPRLSCFLTGGPLTASTSQVSNSKSIDQVIALSRGVEALTLSGPYGSGTDNGFNGEYFSSLSWVGPRAAPKIKSPRVLFDQLFSAGGGTPAPTDLAKAYKKSVLDFAKDEAQRTISSLGKSDREKMDEYLTSLRELEVKINAHEGEVIQCQADTGRPADNNTFENHTKLMMDLLVKAIQCGHTQVASYLMDVEVGNGYRRHHSVSHYTGDSSYPQQYMDVNRWYISQFAYFLNKMKAVKEGDGDLLTNSMIIYGNGIGNGDAHDTRNLGIIVAGKAKGQITPGRILNKSGQPLSNLMLTALQKMGVNQSSFGGSSSPITDL